MKMEEKWPVFQPSPKAERKAIKQPTTFLNTDGRRVSEELFEEMSGMVTLKRKGKDKGGEGSGQTFANHPGLQSLF